MVSAEEVLANPAIHAYLERIIQEEGLELVKRFPKDNEYSDEDLAEKTGINLNSVRNTLYTLYENRLAKYRRIKNNETGWLTYLWRLELENIPVVISEDMEVILEKLKKRQAFEAQNDFYTCKNCGITVTFNEAMGSQFCCPNCDEQYSHFDNELLLNALNTRIARIQENLGHF